MGGWVGGLVGGKGLLYLFVLALSVKGGGRGVQTLLHVEPGDDELWSRWVGGWVGGWVGRGERGGSNELLNAMIGWMGGWVGGRIEASRHSSTLNRATMSSGGWVGGWVGGWMVGPVRLIAEGRGKGGHMGIDAARDHPPTHPPTHPPNPPTVQEAEAQRLMPVRRAHGEDVSIDELDIEVRRGLLPLRLPGGFLGLDGVGGWVGGWSEPPLL